MNRRELLIAGAALASLPMSGWAGQPRKTVILVELAGANDALNMVAPVGDDQYFRLRPTLGLDTNQRIDVDDYFAFNNGMPGLARLFQDGALKVFHNVGYPNQNHSHFRSIEIWERGGDGNTSGRSGWAVDSAMALAKQDYDAPGAYLSGTGNIFHGGGGAFLTGGFKNIFKLASQADIQQTQGTGLLGQLRTRRVEAKEQATEIEHKLQSKRRFSVRGGHLGQQLSDVLKLIDSDIHIPFYKVTHGGFDTHVEQGNTHRRLLQTLDEALTDTYHNLANIGRLEDVVVMTYSEFGRRAMENGARGTDHGSAASHLMLGGSLAGGHIGHKPNLVGLSKGNIKHDIDYRSLYDWVLSQHLEVPDHRFQSFARPFEYFTA